jgi:adenylate kinase family enzyme
MLTDKAILEKAIKEKIASAEAAIITIDGIDGCGKTTIADCLGEQLRIPVIHLDDYIEKNQDGYVDFIRYDELRNALKKARDASSSIIVEGVCVLQVLENIDMTSDYKIYLWKIDNYGKFSDEYGKLYGNSSSLEEKLHVEEQQLHQFAKMSARIYGRPFKNDEVALPGLRRDILTYHWKYGPDKDADIVFGMHQE